MQVPSRATLETPLASERTGLTSRGDPVDFTRGSTFLKKWMEFLEDNADLRYPDVLFLALEA